MRVIAPPRTGILVYSICDKITGRGRHSRLFMGFRDQRPAIDILAGRALLPARPSLQVSVGLPDSWPSHPWNCDTHESARQPRKRRFCFQRRRQKLNFPDLSQPKWPGPLRHSPHPLSRRMKPDTASSRPVRREELRHIDEA
jgi:hypothetical protein